MKEKRINSKIIHVNPQIPSSDLICTAAEIIKNGGVISFPTRHLYGLGADALNEKAVNRVYKIKNRPLNKPISIIISTRKDLKKLVQNIPAAAIKIMDNFWPGGVTIIFQAANLLPQILTAGTGKIGIRLPRHPVAAALVNALGTPVTATSANITGGDGCSEISDMDPGIVSQLDLIIDAGPLEKGPGSTVVDVTKNPPAILRQGIFYKDL